MNLDEPMFLHLQNGKIIVLTLKKLCNSKSNEIIHITCPTRCLAYNKRLTKMVTALMVVIELQAGIHT